MGLIDKVVYFLTLATGIMAVIWGGFWFYLIFTVVISIGIGHMLYKKK